MAREYILRDYEPTPDGQPSKWSSNKAMLRKSTAELRGICKAFLLDGVITIEESDMLRKWIGEHPVISQDPMAAALMKRVARIYADGVVTPEERLELKDFLTNYVGEDKKPNVTVFNE